MGVKTTTSHIVVCDRCGADEPIDRDPMETGFTREEGWAWWNRVGPDGEISGIDQILLCAGCVELLRLFFQGKHTPGGQAFNVNECQRMATARRAQLDHVEDERCAPWT